MNLFDDQKSIDKLSATLFAAAATGFAAQAYGANKTTRVIAMAFGGWIGYCMANRLADPVYVAAVPYSGGTPYPTTMQDSAYTGPEYICDITSKIPPFSF